MSAGDLHHTPAMFIPLPPLSNIHADKLDLLSPTDAGWRSPASTVGTDPFPLDNDVGFDLDFTELGDWSDTLSPPTVPHMGTSMLEGTAEKMHSGTSPAIAGLSLEGEAPACTTASARGHNIPLGDGMIDGDIFGMDLDMTTAWTPLDTVHTQSVTSTPSSSAHQIPSVTVSNFTDFGQIRRHNTWHDDFHVFLPSPTSAGFYAPLGTSATRLTRAPSLKRRRSKWDCGLEGPKDKKCACARPDIAKPGQREKLDRLPTEILLIIFEYAYFTPDKPENGCPHEREKGNRMFEGITRRATTGSIGATVRPWMMGSSFLNGTHSPAAGPSSASVTAQGPTSAPANPDPNPDEPDVKTEELRIYRAKTLLNIMLTCKQFYRILAADEGTDEKFWRTAARWCWDWLPERLADVQGSNSTSQTSWRNLVAVFMRSENGLFGKKNGGKGGVESFGGRREGTDALTWDEFQRLKMSNDGKKRKVVLVCAQPAPDMFAALPKEDGDGWILSLSVRDHPMQNTLVQLDSNGEFGHRPARLPVEMKRNLRAPDFFQPDIFAIGNDRMKLVKVSHDGISPHGITQVEWDLSVIPEMISDPRAQPARAVSHQGRLLCNLYTHNARDPPQTDLLQFLDPPENSAIFCLESSLLTQPPYSPSLSSTRLGKKPAPGTKFLWKREFTYPNAADYDPSQSLHSIICNLSLTANHAIALIRWNITTPESAEEFVDRAFHIICPSTGSIIRVLEFPHLYWDYRHHDMCADYNNIRLRKLQRLFNHLPPGTAVGAGNRCTRIHNDRFVVTTDGRLVSGSHDYCNWVWDLNKKPDGRKGVYTETRNDAGICDEFDVLDDYYWSDQTNDTHPSAPTSTPTADTNCTSSSSTTAPKKIWTSTSERAGWWVRTPNQILCFWHNIALSVDNTLFAACRPGKLFLWNLAIEKPNDHILGFQFNPGKDRWLGRLAKAAERLRSRLRGWFVWGGVVPKQALWLVVEETDAKQAKILRTVYVEREELLRVTGVGGSWEFGSKDFVMEEEGEEMSDSDMEEEGESEEESEEEAADVLGMMGGLRRESNGRKDSNGRRDSSGRRESRDTTNGGDGERRKKRRVSSSASAAQWEDEVERSFMFAAEGEEVI